MQLLAFVTLLASCCGASDNSNEEGPNGAIVLDATFVNRKWFNLKKNTKQGRYSFYFDEENGALKRLPKNIKAKWSKKKIQKKTKIYIFSERTRLIQENGQLTIENMTYQGKSIWRSEWCKHKTATVTLKGAKDMNTQAQQEIYDRTMYRPFIQQIVSYAKSKGYKVVNQCIEMQTITTRPRATTSTSISPRSSTCRRSSNEDADEEFRGVINRTSVIVAAARSNASAEEKSPEVPESSVINAVEDSDENAGKTNSSDVTDPSQPQRSITDKVQDAAKAKKLREWEQKSDEEKRKKFKADMLAAAQSHVAPVAKQTVVSQETRDRRDAFAAAVVAAYQKSDN